MQVFFHHVGAAGSGDFDKTVFPSVNISLVENAVPPETRQALVSELTRLFPSGTFQCWGVPEGAKTVIKRLAAGDAVLLVRGLNVEDSVPALCPVKLFLPLKFPDLSQALWGDVRYPYIFFFDTVRLNYTWPELTQDLGYLPNWNPAGTFNRVTEPRLEKFGGASGYIEVLRHSYSVLPALPNGVSADEAAGEPRLQSGEVDVHAVNAAIQQLKAETAEQGDAPSLTEVASVDTYQVLARAAAFRVQVKRLYGSRCAVCGAGARGPKQETEVEAAHIYPKGKMGSDNLCNGICFCKRHHWAFDVGWLVIENDYSITVHPDMPKDPDYQFIVAWQGRSIQLPKQQEFWPHPVFLTAQRQLFAAPLLPEHGSGKILPRNILLVKEVAGNKRVTND